MSAVQPNVTRYYTSMSADEKPHQMESSDNPPRFAIRWLLKQASTGKEIETRTMRGLKVLEVQKGFIRCGYTVQLEACIGQDKDGYWHVGAISTLLDDVSGAASFSAAGHIKASVEFAISFFSQVKLHEEVEIEAKLVGETGRMASAVVEVKRKSGGELIAFGKQWMAQAALTTKITKDRNDVVKKSKL